MDPLTFLIFLLPLAGPASAVYLVIAFTRRAR